MSRHPAGAFALGLALAFWVMVSGCPSKKSASDHKHAGPQAIGHSECASCSMVVVEQPAPRGQLVHRDGTRAQFCSIDDMLQYMKAPSRHGAAVEVYVEVMEPKVDPATTPVAELPFKAAAAVHFVTGVKREGIMGPPVLTYEHAADAQSVAKQHGGQVRTWAQLQKGPGPQASDDRGAK